MKWNKYVMEEGKISGIIGLAILLILISLYMQSKLVLFIAVFFLSAVIVNRVYLKKAGDQFYFENINDKSRLFINEKGKWMLKFQNVGVPILSGELRITFDHFVAPKGSYTSSSLSIHEVSVPFTLFTHQTKEIYIPISAELRGIAKIHKLEVHIPSLFGFGETRLEFAEFIKQQAVVYPKPIPVKGLKEQLSITPGDSPVSYSIYEQRNGQIGTRNYIPSDSFNQIHWKATAKRQVLQTKIFEKVTEKGVTISLNISNGHSITGQLEGYLSSITQFAYFAFKSCIPYSLCINVRTAGKIPFIYLPKGEGKEHLQRVLETLASISIYSTSIPYQVMLSYLQRHLACQPVLIHAGILTNEANQRLLIESQKGVQLLELTVDNEQGMLTALMNGDGKRRAQ
ncbi:DUF58 domain-containing protein [Neobacillus dielmonensis]|uniref:DUF58 domain-containing protein n=1 Tax=Neobacillus dielmonensis TaxID=1347369 RepID=UPI0005AAE6F6|nr:DUF58 domain-containing protein [Neobacillus dielmonensis]